MKTWYKVIEEWSYGSDSFDYVLIDEDKSTPNSIAYSWTPRNSGDSGSYYFHKATLIKENPSMEWLKTEFINVSQQLNSLNMYMDSILEEQHRQLKARGVTQ